MLTRVKAFSLAMAALLVLTLVPGAPTTAAPPSPWPVGVRAAADAENVEFVGHIGGPTEAVAVQGDYAYIGIGPRLVILDVSDSANPMVVGRTNVLPGIVRSVAVAGDYAYIAADNVDYGGLLWVGDVSTPSSPMEVGFYDTPGNAHGVAVAGGYAYIADVSGLRVVDISTPADPTEVGFYDTPGSAQGVAVAGDYAYVADGDDGGLRVVDVSTPSNPMEVGFYGTPGSAQGVAVAGSYAYIADYWEGLRVVDVSTPSNPTEAGFYDTPGIAEDVAIAHDYAYVANGDFGMWVVDVSTPSNPAGVGHCDTPGIAEDVAIAHDYAYVADNGGGLRVMDVSDPANPAEVGARGGTPGWPNDVAVSGDYAYIADGFGLLWVVGVSTPTNPTGIGFCKTWGYAAGVAVAEDYAYVANFDDGMRVVDISTPSNPARAGRCDTPGSAWGVAIAGSYAYVADRDGGLRVVDVSDPANPTEVSFYDTPGSAWGVAVAGGYAYVADGADGLRVVDVSTPSNPTEVGALGGTPVSAYDVAVAGDYAYVAAGGLQVVDVSDPTNPTEVGFYGPLATTYGVAVAGDYAYITLYNELRVVDISDPANPTGVGFYGTPQGDMAVAVAGGYAYVANWLVGLFILRYTGAEPTYFVSGYIRDGSGNPIPGVVVSAGAGGSATTDASGIYTITNLVTSTYTLTPSKSGYVFSPATCTVSVPPSATGQDFIGSSETLSVSLSADPSGGTAPLNNVDLAAEVSGSAVGTINYTFYCNRSDSGTNITPDWDAKFDGIFDNPKTAIDVCDYSAADTYTAKVIAERGTKQAEDRVTIAVHSGGDSTYSVTGHIHDGGGNPILGVAVSAGAGGSAVTDASGAYTITDLITGTYVVTASKSGWTFTPVTRTVSVPPSATGQDFTGSVMSTLPIVTTQPASEPTLTSATLNGTINPNESDTSAWFEWGTDPDLATFSSTPEQTVGTGTVPVAVTAVLTGLQPGTPYYYRAAAINAAGASRGTIQRLIILLGNNPTARQNLYWNKYDCLIYTWAHQKNLPAPLVKAVIAHESGGLGSRKSLDRPALAFLYEPVTVDERYVTPAIRSGNLPGAHLAGYVLPGNPPPSGKEPYNRFWGRFVSIPSGTTNRQMMSKDYPLLYGLTNPYGTPGAEFVAQYRLATSYGLGQVVYWWHHQLIGDDPPEALYEPETAIKVSATILARYQDRCAPGLTEAMSEFDPWKPVLQAYNSGRCNGAPAYVQRQL